MLESNQLKPDLYVRRTLLAATHWNAKVYISVATGGQMGETAPNRPRTRSW